MVIKSKINKVLLRTSDTEKYITNLYITLNMKSENTHSFSDVLKSITQDRGRTNILRKYEQNALAYLVQRVPAFISSDMLTAIGFFGSIIIFTSFVLASFFGPIYLLLGVFGYFVSWLGDSLDGRLAYYRNKQRKWYGFALDLAADWIGVALMGFGYVIYIENSWEIIGFSFVVLYGWEILTTLVRYKVTNKYSIDSGLLGPTEVRIVISLMLVLEVFVKDSLIYTASIACVILLISNLVDFYKLLKMADAQDKAEKELKKNE
jgi:phosphatidylglycerophosphate synthase